MQVSCNGFLVEVFVSHSFRGDEETDPVVDFDIVGMEVESFNEVCDCDYALNLMDLEERVLEALIEGEG